MARSDEAKDKPLYMISVAAELTGIMEAELDANADAFLRTFDTP